MMENEFRPDGWLGLLLGSKLWINFTNPKGVESDVSVLVKHIGSKWLTKKENIVPVQEIPFGEKPGDDIDLQKGMPQYLIHSIS